MVAGADGGAGLEAGLGVVDLCNGDPGWEGDGVADLVCGADGPLGWWVAVPADVDLPRGGGREVGEDDARGSGGFGVEGEGEGDAVREDDGVVGGAGGEDEGEGDGVGEAAGDLEGFGEAVATPGEVDVGVVKGGLVPSGGEAGANGEGGAEEVGEDAEEAFDEGAGGDADGVGEVALGLLAVGIELGGHVEVAGAEAPEHGVEEVALEKGEGPVGEAGLPEGEGEVHVFGEGEEVERPEVGEPVGAGEQVPWAIRDALAVDGYGAEGGEAVGDDLPGLTRRRELAVNGVVGGPEGGAGLEGLGEEEVARLGKGADFGHPEELGKSLVDEVGLFVEGCGVLVEDAGDSGGGAIEEVVVGGGVGGPAAVALEIVAGPDAGVGLVEGKGLAVGWGLGVGVGEGAAKIAVLPVRVAREGGPDLACEVHVAGPAEVANEGVEEDQVHVVVIGREVAVRVQESFLAGEVRAGVGGAGCGSVGILRGGERRLVLQLDPVTEVRSHAVVAAEGVEGVGAAPACERNAPGDGTVHDTLL